MTALPPIIRPTVQNLPLGELTPQQFQSFCRDVVQALPSVAHCRQEGVEGDAQAGIDLVADLVDGRTAAYQCKREAQFGRAKFKAAIAEATYEADEYYLMLSRRATAALRKAEREHPGWTIWDQDDICGKLRVEIPIEDARRIVRTYFGSDACRDFLGIAPVTPFLHADEFFAPLLNAGRIFHHTWQLVGRTAEVESLRAFVTSEKRVYVLSGRGGTGKSRLLRAFTSEPGTALPVYFVSTTIPVNPEALSELPTGGAVLIVDDAHRRKDLPILLDYTARSHSKLLLATRPQLRAELPSLVTHAGLATEDVEMPNVLAGLSFEAHTELATEVLGPNLRHHAASLAEATRDCPLITVVGGALLRDEHVGIGLLVNHDAFRTTVLARFTDEVVDGAQPGTERAALRKLLEVIAALAPIHPRSERFLRAATALSGMSQDDAARWCDALLAQGILIADEHGARIAPDVLSDYILGEACVREDTPPFAERLVQAVGTFDPALLRNLAAVDWRTGVRTGAELAVLGGVWREVVKTFEAAPNSERSRMLRELHDIGYYLPEQMLALANLAVDTPATAAEESPFAEYTRTSHADVLAQLPEVLRIVAYSEAHFDRACDLLWRLILEGVGASGRQLSNEGPVETLRRMMAFSLHRRTIHEKLMSRVEAWLAVATSSRERALLASVVEPLLAKTSTDHTSHDNTLTIQSFTIPRQWSAAVRDRARTLLRTLLEDEDRGVVSAAVKALGAAIQTPYSLGGLVVPDAFIEECIPEQVSALGDLQSLVSRKNDPIIAAQVTDLASPYASERTRPQIRSAAEALLAAIPQTPENLVALSVHDPWGHRFHRQDHAPPEVCVKEAAEVLAALRAEDAVQLLSDTIQGLQDLGLHATPHILLGELARSAPAAADALFRAVVAADASTLAAHAGAILGPRHGSDPDAFHALVDEAIAAEATNVCAAVAGVYRWWLQELPDERDIAAISRLFDLGGVVADAALEALPNLARIDASTAANLLGRVEIRGRDSMAIRVAELFVQPESPLFDVLTDEQLTAVLMQFAPVPQIQHWNIEAFLKACVKRVPIGVATMFLERLRFDHAQDVIAFNVVPYDLGPLELAEEVASAPAYESVLLQVAEMGEAGQHYEASKVFRLLAGEAGGESALRTLSAKRTDAASTFVANCLRGDAVRRVILSDAAFAAQLLDDAQSVGTDTRDAVAEALVDGAVPRETTPELRASILEAAARLRDQSPIGSRVRQVYERIVARVERINRSIPPSDTDVEEELE